MDFDVQAIRNKEMSLKKIETSKRIYKIIKRIIDIFGALVGCVILIPLTIGIWIANRITKDDGPVFCVQKRLGEDGKPFRMYKFRSMVKDADRKLKKYLKENPDVNEEFMKYRKIKNDPRITPVGRFIRNTSLDEFPQFINVLKGDMSLVGPRPYLFREKRAIKRAYSTIIKIKPGVTGPWQVRGRNKISLEERMNMDIEYVKNENIFDDLKYLLRTVTELFKK